MRVQIAALLNLTANTTRLFSVVLDIVELFNLDAKNANVAQLDDTSRYVMDYVNVLTRRV